MRVSNYYCGICGERLSYNSHNQLVHQNGQVYKGKCYCEHEQHFYSHDATGHLICKTWKNDHSVHQVPIHT